MATENDAGRDKRLVATLGGVAVAVICGGLYLVWSWWSASTPTPSRMNAINDVAGGGRSQTAETPAYRSLLREYNQKGAAHAKAENSSFIASIPVGNTIPVNQPASEAVSPPSRPAPRHYQAQQANRQTGQELSDAQKAALQVLMKRLNGPDEQPSGLALIAVGTDPGEPEGKTRQDTSFADWTNSVISQDVVRHSQIPVTALQASDAIIIPAFTRTPGTITIGVDSDNSSTPVLGHIWTGPFAGVTLKADRSQLAGDGVVIHFTTMSWKGKSWQVDAYALKDDTLMANVATDVSHRYFERVFIPAVAGGLSKVGQLYADANTSILTNGYNTVTSRVGAPDGKAVAGVMAGGMAGEAGNVLKQDAARLPPIQATVTAGQPVYIQFMDAVTAASEIKRGNAPASTATGVSPQPFAQTPVSQPLSPTLAELRAQTDQRIHQRLNQQSGTGE